MLLGLSKFLFVLGHFVCPLYLCFQMCRHKVHYILFPFKPLLYLCVPFVISNIIYFCLASIFLINLARDLSISFIFQRTSFALLIVPQYTALYFLRFYFFSVFLFFSFSFFVFLLFSLYHLELNA